MSPRHDSASKRHFSIAGNIAEQPENDCLKMFPPDEILKSRVTPAMMVSTNNILVGVSFIITMSYQKLNIVIYWYYKHGLPLHNEGPAFLQAGGAPLENQIAAGHLHLLQRVN